MVDTEITITADTEQAQEDIEDLADAAEDATEAINELIDALERLGVDNPKAEASKRLTQDLNYDSNMSNFGVEQDFLEINRQLDRRNTDGF